MITAGYKNVKELYITLSSRSELDVTGDVKLFLRQVVSHISPDILKNKLLQSDIVKLAAAVNCVDDTVFQEGIEAAAAET